MELLTRQSEIGGELVERARALVPALMERAAEAERMRRVPEESIRELTAAGLLRVSVPRRFGGHEADMRTAVQVSAEVARGCGSTGWVVSVMNSAAWLVGLYAERAQREVFGASPETLVATVPAPKGSTAICRRQPGGVLVSGRWDASSGCLHAGWFVLGAALVDDRRQRVDDALLLIPAAALEIKDTWFTAGMRATGSNSVLARDVHVPEHRVLLMSRAREDTYASEHTATEALYRSAFAPTLALTLVGPLLGLARSALEVVLAQLPHRSIAYTVYDKQSEAPVTHLQVAEAAVKTDAAHLLVQRSGAALDGAAAAGRRLDVAARVRLRADVGYAARLCREAVDILVSVSGASGMAEQKPIQRIWRDVTTASVHALLQPTTNLELYGRVLLGLEPSISLLV